MERNLKSVVTEEKNEAAFFEAYLKHSTMPIKLEGQGKHLVKFLPSEFSTIRGDIRLKLIFSSLRLAGRAVTSHDLKVSISLNQPTPGMGKKRRRERIGKRNA